MTHKSLLAISFGLLFLFSCNSGTTNPSDLSATEESKGIEQENKFSFEYEGLDNVSLKIDSIDILYHNTVFKHSAILQSRKKMTLNIPDFTNEHAKKGIFPAKIADETTLKLIQQELEKLTPSEKKYIHDIRVLMDVHYKDGTAKKIDLCGPFSDEIFIDETPHNSNNRLAYIVKNAIGLYSWVKDEPTFSMFPEIKDSTIIKEPIIESPWYIEYLKHKIIFE